MVTIKSKKLLSERLAASKVRAQFFLITASEGEGERELSVALAKRASTYSFVPLHLHCSCWVLSPQARFLQASLKLLSVPGYIRSSVCSS